MIKNFEPTLRVYYIPNGYTPKRLPRIEKGYAKEQLGIPLDKKSAF